jgi:hypothetical protein
MELKGEKVNIFAKDAMAESKQGLDSGQIITVVNLPFF